jgi:hypothetical protein
MAKHFSPYRRGSAGTEPRIGSGCKFPTPSPSPILALPFFETKNCANAQSIVTLTPSSHNSLFRDITFRRSIDNVVRRLARLWVG